MYAFLEAATTATATAQSNSWRTDPTLADEAQALRIRTSSSAALNGTASTAWRC